MSSLTRLASVDEEHASELKVTFFPPLFLQRRMWILDVMRAEKITKVLDIGCGEGQLLGVLCQPAPWLPPPPADVLPPVEDSPDAAEKSPLSPTYNDDIPNIHPTQIIGLDVSADDLNFAVEVTTPPHPSRHQHTACFTNVGLRWEDLDAKIWKGGLEVINESFVDIECIVSTEVIEHLSPEIFPAFAPVLLGVYHPQIFLITTPSYTFNARFTAPMAPLSARKGYPDPTNRTDRIFRHSDHKFEWTVEEFQTWCDDVAKDWGYDVQVSSVGHPIELDEWGRDEKLGGASSIATFRRREINGREQKGRETLKALGLATQPHELLAHHQHFAHANSKQPGSLEAIASKVKATMEEAREGFMRIEDLWFELDIAALCGGWIEMLIRAVEQSEFLVLKKDEEFTGKRVKWTVELIGGVLLSKEYWTREGKPNADTISFDWVPSEGEPESSEGEWDGSTDMDGDISWNESEGEEDFDDSVSWSHSSQWDTEEGTAFPRRTGWGTIHDVGEEFEDMPDSGGNSTTGWDGDESEDTS